jgi:hypothetical protein
VHAVLRRLTAEYVPTGHIRGLPDPAGQYRPGGHSATPVCTAPSLTTVAFQNSPTTAALQPYSTPVSVTFLFTIAASAVRAT